MFLRFVFLLAGTSIAWAQQSFFPVVRATPGTSQVLYGSYGSSVIRSDDLGTTWKPLYITEAGRPQPPLAFVEVDASLDSTVFYITSFAAGPVWKSTDSGATWSSANSGLPGAGNVDYFKQTRGNPAALYLRSGQQLYKTADRAVTWKLQSTLPDANGILEVSDSNPTRMYFLSRTLQVSISDDEGASWRGAGTVFVSPGVQPVGLGIPFSDPNTVYVGTTISPNIADTGAFRSTNSGSSFVQLNNGIASFSKIFTGQNGPLYAPSAQVGGFYRSDDNGSLWKSFSIISGVLYNLTAIDPKSRRTIYATRNGQASGPVRSTDGGDTWVPFSSTITPSIAKSSSVVRLIVEEGAPYSQPLSIQAAEDSTWKIGYTLAVSGAPWLSLSATSGTTPSNQFITVSTSGLKPGTYRASIQINAPSSNNKSVTLPVELTVLPQGSAGARYSVSTVLGNGDTTVTRFTGKAIEIAVGPPNVLAIDSTGGLLAATDVRLWQVAGTDAGAIAGTGTPGDGGDDGPANQAQLNIPTGIGVDAQSNIFLAESGARRLRKISGGTISTVADAKTPILAADGSVTGSALFSPTGIAFDALNRLTLLDLLRVLRFNGTSFSPLPLQFTGSGLTRVVTPIGLVADSKNNLYFTDQTQDYVLKLTSAGALSVVAGTGVTGFSGDGGPATAAQLHSPSGLGMDSQGNLYVADSGNLRVRMISPEGTIQTIAGTGRAIFEGDGGSGSSASFRSMAGIAVDKQGAVYVAEPLSARVRKLTPPGAATPTLSGLLHGASGDKTLSPGSLFSLYGNFAIPVPAITGSTPWPASLGGVVVLINGVIAPLYYVSGTQINGQIPYETLPGQATAVVSVNGSLTAQTSFAVIAANPGILVFNENRAVAVNPDGSVNTGATPVAPGEIELLYLTGLGQPDQSVATGEGAPLAEPLARAKYTFSITLNGQPVTVYYLGLAPGYPALAQANFGIPPLPAGDYPLVVTVNGVASNTTVITVRPH